MVLLRNLRKYICYFKVFLEIIFEASIPPLDVVDFNIQWEGRDGTQNTKKKWKYTLFPPSGHSLYLYILQLQKQNCSFFDKSPPLQS